MSKTKNRVALFSDLHLGIHQNSEKWLDTAYEWAKWFVADLQKKGINTVLFGGDWFHNRTAISTNTLHKTQEILNLFRHADIRIHAIVGNHDCFFKDNTNIHSTNILKNHTHVTIYDQPTIVSFGKMDFQMCPWGTTLEQIERCDMLLGHFEINTFQFNSVKMCEHGYNATDLLSRTPFIWSGHFHIGQRRAYQKGKIIYIGNPFVMDMHDINDAKGYYILDVDTGEYEQIINDISPQHVKIYASKIDDVDTRSLKGRIVKLVIDEQLNDKQLAKIAGNINQAQPFETSRDIQFKFAADVDFQVDEDATEIDIEQMITQYVEELDIPHKKQVLAKTLEIYKECSAT